MATTIAEKSKEIVSNMIKNAFEDIEDQPWNDDRYYELIDTASNFGLHELANQLLHDLPYQYQKNEYFNRQYTKK